MTVTEAPRGGGAGGARASMVALSYRLLGAIERARANPHTPLRLLWILSALSLGARIYRIDSPRQGAGGALIFDETYYVNAARVLLHIPVPCHGSNSCDPYASNPGGTDPNSEHPPLGKVMVAAGMKLFGDNPFGWRFLPVVFGSLAILALFWLVRTAGGGRWLALGAASLMAVDNLSLVHGRIATLDVFVITFMLVAVALYLSGHPLLAGVALGIGACTKLVAPDVLLVLLVLELARIGVQRAWRDPGGWRALPRRLLPFALCAGVSIVVFLGALEILDVAVKPFHDPGDSCPGSGNSYANSLQHARFMLCYADKLNSPQGPTGIASYPWQWLIDQEPINYYSSNVTVTTGQTSTTHPVISVMGVMNPAIVLMALPALGLAVATAVRERDELSMLVVAWFAGTYLPFVVYSIVQQRTSYLYYMVIVVPAIYIAVARVFARLPRSVLAGYVAILGYEFWALYPFRTWQGPFG